MMDKALRIPKERVLQPFIKPLARVSPTTLTVIGLGVGLAAAVAAAFAQPYLALALWIGNRIVDGLDGELARATERQSDLGGYLDIMADLTIYAAIPLGLSFAQASPGTWLALAVLLSLFYINAGSWMYLSALLEKSKQGAFARSERTSVTMPTGIIEGTETVIFYSLFLIFPAYLTVLFWVLSSLVILTIFQRLWWAQKNL